MAKSGVAILGIYAADLAFSAPRQPAIGETLIGSKFGLGPGGKGSNQAVATARAGGKVTFISRVGKDAFGDIALNMYAKEGINALVPRDENHASGAAYIFVQEGTGANAIIVVPGAAGQISNADIDAAREAITSSAVFMTQLETPVAVGHYALKMAKEAGVTTIFNPAPAMPLDDSIYALCDYATPNETEATMLTGVEITGVDSARKAGDVLLKKGVGTALITLGGQGALLHGKAGSFHIPIYSAGKVVDTAGAGDAFNGGFAAALSKGMAPEDAARFGSAAAGISVTRYGTAPSTPHLHEIEALLKK
ncbi:ribokinase [Aestuariivirga litoralis]|uniref:ribokinase n=1 Tax=Aestuariivirga litoralis TaxID=2650924 RepID=UPI0018C7671C|nr:ribokinase [Aestuariivirga litoralis]MBG1233319.1 ribokinase [Aestuariivirga litoralis]